MFRKEEKTAVDEYPDAEKGAHLDPTTSEGLESGAQTHDAVFGELTEDGPNYRAVSLGKSRG